MKDEAMRQFYRLQLRADQVEFRFRNGVQNLVLNGRAMDRPDFCVANFFLNIRTLQTCSSYKRD